MKSFLLTMLAFCFAVVAYAQAPNAQRRSAIQTKSDAGNASNPSNTGLTTAAGSGRGTVNNVSPSTGITVLSPMPAVFLWKLPISLPNPFIKEDD